MSTDWGAAQWGDSEGNPVVSDSETPALPAPIDAPADLDGIDQHGTDLDFAEMGLGELAAMANEYHTKAEGSARSALEAAWIAGSALLAAKDQLGHGEWLPWVQANFYGSRQTAADYMRIAKNVGNADNVVSSLHLENTTQSINAALNAISKSTRTPGPKPDNNPKPLTPKQYLERLDALRKASPNVLRQLATITGDDAERYAKTMLEATDAIEEVYDWVCTVADRTEHGAA